MESLITDIEQFLAHHSMPATQFGELALKDRSFVRQLRAGRRVWPETEERIRDFMRDYVPQAAAA